MALAGDGSADGNELSPPSVSWEASFPPEVASVRGARIGAADAVRDAGLSLRSMADALLVVTELVGNAVRHARTDLTVTVTVRGDVLRIEVFDLDTRPPALLGLDDESTSGRGLHIVAGIATDWGWRTAQSADGVSGKRVWAELTVDRRPPAEPS
jgi:anti-sigma regulatory factor (Ser/Thr protein kinase)